MEDWRSPRSWREKKRRRARGVGGEGVNMRKGGVLRKQGDDEDPICLKSEESVCEVSRGASGEKAGFKPCADLKTIN